MSTNSVSLNQPPAGELVGATATAVTSTNPVRQSVPPRVHEVLAALDSAGIHCVVLRDYEQLTELPRDGMEVDLLVDPTAIEPMTAILRQYDFVFIPTRGHSPHRFYLGYDEAHDAWTILDVVTDLRFGRPGRPLATDGLTDDFLTGAVPRPLARVLAPEHRLLKLLLSCLLNEGQFSAGAQSELLRLNSQLCPAGVQRLAALMARLLGSALDWEFVESALERHDFAALLKRRAAAWWRLFRRAPARNMLRWCGTLLARRCSGFLGPGGSGMLVALLGPDGAGKSTLARVLSSTPKLRTCTVYMGSVPPRPRFPFGLLPSLDARLQRLYAAEQDAAIPLHDRALRKAQSLAYALTQCLLMALALYRRATGWLVIFDRYSYDSRIKVPARRASLRERLLRAVSPGLDLILILDAPGLMLFARKKEHSPEYLERNREAYRILARQLPHATVLDASGDVSLLRRQARFALWSRYCEKH